MYFFLRSLEFALIDFVRCLIVVRCVKPFPVVELHVAFNPGLQLDHRPVVVEVDVLVLQASPEALDEDVVQSSVHAVHADFYMVSFENGDEGIRGELAALVRVEDRRNPVKRDCLLKSRYAELSVEGVRNSPGEYLPRVEVDNRREIHDAARELDIRDVRSPDLVRKPYSLASQQVRILLVVFRWYARSFARI